MLEALPLLGKPGVAMDLGCGVGHTSLVLGERGWQVLGIDSLPEPIAIAEERTQHLPNARHEVADFRTYPFPPNNLITAFNTLFFVPIEDFWTVWERIRTSLMPGGHFVGQILGDQDEWASESIAGIRPDEVPRLVQAFEPIKLEHVQRPGHTVFGEPKDWDVYHCILKRT